MFLIFLTPAAVYNKVVISGYLGLKGSYPLQPYVVFCNPSDVYIAIQLLVKAYVASRQGCDCRQWLVYALSGCQNMHKNRDFLSVQVKTGLNAYSHLMASLNCSKVGSPMMS